MCKCTPEIRTPFCGAPGCEMPPQDKTRPIIAYWLEREDCPGRMLAGTTPHEVAEALKQELVDDRDSTLPADELSTIRLVPYETTQAEIDALPEFQGW